MCPGRYPPGHLRAGGRHRGVTDGCEVECGARSVTLRAHAGWGASEVTPLSSPFLLERPRASAYSAHKTTLSSRANPSGTPPAILTRRGSATTGDAARQTRLFGRGHCPTVNPPADTILDGGNRASDAYCHNHEEGVGNHGRRGEVVLTAGIFPPVHPPAEAILDGGNRASAKSPRATTFPSRADPSGTPPAILTRRGSAIT